MGQDNFNQDWSSVSADMLSGVYERPLPLPAPAARTVRPRSSRGAPPSARCKPTGDATLSLSAAMVSARPARPGFFPLDDELALLPGRVTPRLDEELVHLATWMPFAQAAKHLARSTRV